VVRINQSLWGDGAFATASYRQGYRLSDLISQCDLNAPAPDLGEWDKMKPAGQEVL